MTMGTAAHSPIATKNNAPYLTLTVLNSREGHHPNDGDKHHRKDEDVPSLITIGGSSDEHA